MPTIQIDTIEQQLFTPEISRKIVADFNLQGHFGTPRQFADAFLISLGQTPVFNPVSASPDNSQVFEAAVRALGSNSRKWSTFLANEPALKKALFGYDPGKVVANGTLPLSLMKYLPGQTSPNDSQAIIAWAHILEAVPNYYHAVIVPVAMLLHQSGPLLSLSEIMLCIVGFFGSGPALFKQCPVWAAVLPQFFQKNTCCGTWSYTGSRGKTISRNIVCRRWKFPGMGYALGAEFMRNLGWNGFKVDRHIKRLFSLWISGTDPIAGARAARLAGILGASSAGLMEFFYHSLLGMALSPCGMWYSHVDNLVWALGAYVEKKGRTSSISYVQNSSTGALNSCRFISCPNQEIGIEGKEISRRCFSALQVINLSSDHDWTDRVRTLLLDSTAASWGVFRSVSPLHLYKRFGELKYVCLVSELEIEKTREAFPGLSKNSGHGVLEELLAATQKNERPRDEFPETNGDNSTISSFPHYGVAGDPAAMTVVVDCYGIYVPSIKNWVRGVSGHYGPEITGKWLGKLADDGPAVILCPEAIARLCREMLQKSKLTERFGDFYMDLERILLKLTLLHELGHHVFPVNTKMKAEYIWETMANWFAYCHVSPMERAVLHEKTQMQTLPYRMYQGMLPLAYRKNFRWLAEMQVPQYSPDGRNYAQWLEQKVFDGSAKDPRFYGINQIGAEWYSWFWGQGKSPQVALFAHPNGMGFAHPAEVMALMLLNETVFFGVSHRIDQMRKNPSFSFHPVPRAGQECALSKIFGQGCYP